MDASITKNYASPFQTSWTTFWPAPAMTGRLNLTYKIAIGRKRMSLMKMSKATLLKHKPSTCKAINENIH